MGEKQMKKNAYTVFYKFYHSNAGYIGEYTKVVFADSKSEARKICKEVLVKNSLNIGGVYSYKIGKAILKE